MTQLNKLQIKAEILTVLSNLQTNFDDAKIEELLATLIEQKDKKSIREVLIKELLKANEKRAVLICFLLLKLCGGKEAEDALWDVLKTPAIPDVTKAIILNLLKDMGTKINYEELEEYLEDPNEVIDADTKKLLHAAIINPEAQIDFLDFVNSLPDADAKLLVQSLGEDYSSNELANILNPLVLYNPTSKLGHMAIDILGNTKSQLALHTLLETLDFVNEEDTSALIKKNISKLKISGVREDNSTEFYKNILSSKPYEAYASYPDGHGNQAIIFSREKEDEIIQLVAVVVNDTWGIMDCFGFNEISQTEFQRIVDKFYRGDEHIRIDIHVAKDILLNAEKLTRKTNGKTPYEYICWRSLLADVEAEQVPIELTLRSRIDKKSLSDKDLGKIYKLDFIQRWFFDTSYNDEFKMLINNLNGRIEDKFSIDFESIVEESFDEIFSSSQKDLLDKRILMSAYLKFLSGDKEMTELLYSLYSDEDKKNRLAKNIIRKSIYEYYVSLKFKYKQEHKMTNIFVMKNRPKTEELTIKQIESIIGAIEKLWVKRSEA
ncbi:MAG: hypothetical protein PHC64_07230 [Candidatus Gastranaerophilales bacterium]|nr:hypothetical protein [Candidatus Gastranaerophilales bacterium]